MQKSILSNGITVISDSLGASDIVSIQTTVNVGGIFEDSEQAGISHFTEHMLFKGTKKRSGSDIDCEMEMLGAEFNACTSFETTSYEVTALNATYKEALAIMLDAVFYSTFPSEEITSERSVICEEISRYKDNPNSLLGQRVLQLCFAKSPFSRPILGSLETVQAISQADLISFHRKWYVPSNITIYAAGAINHSDLISFIEGETKTVAPKTIPDKATTPAEYPIRFTAEIIPMEHADSRVEVAFKSYRPDECESPLIDICCHALTAMDESPLISVMRDERQMVSYLGGSAFNTTDMGIATISFMPYEGQEDESIVELQSLLKQLSQGELLGQLCERAKSVFAVDRIRNSQTAEGRCRSLGNSDSMARGPGHEDWYYATIANADVTQFYEVFETVFCAANPVIVALVNKNKTQPNVDTWQPKDKVRNSVPVRVEQMRTTEVDLKPGIKLVYQQIPGEQQFSLAAATEGGLRGDSQGVLGQQFFMGSLLGRSSQSKDFLELSSIMDQFGSSLEGFSGKDSLGLCFNSLAKDADSLISYWAEALLNPAFPEQQLDVLKKQCIQSVSLETDDAGYRSMHLLRKALYAEHPYAYPQYGSKANFESFSATELEHEFRTYRDSGNWVICAAGPQSIDHFTAVLNKEIEGWSPSAQKRNLKQSQILLKKTQRIHETMDREQTHLILGRVGLDWQSNERYALDVVSSIMAGSSGRLFSSLRNEEGLVYSASPIISHAKESGVIGFHAATSPEKLAKVISAIEKQCVDLGQNEVSFKELTKAANQIQLGHALQNEPSEVRVLSMALMQLYGLGWSDYEDYLERVKAVTPNEIKKFAAQYLDLSDWVQVTVGPG